MNGDTGLMLPGPDVRIRTKTRANSSQRVLELERPSTGETIYVPVQPPNIIQELSSRLGRAIADALSKYHGYYKMSPQDAGDLLGLIASAGRVFLLGVLGNPKRDCYELTAFLQRACVPRALGNSSPPLIYVVVGEHNESIGEEPDDDVRPVPEQDYFPWELLPLFDQLVNCGQASDQVGLEEVCEAFVGFSAIVERCYAHGPVGKGYLSGWHQLPVRLIYNAEHEGARKEVGYFRAHGNVLLEGPYPRSVGDPAAPSLGRQLGYPHLGIDGSMRSRGDEIVHITVHCDAQGERSDDYSIHMADEFNRPMVVKLRELDDEIYTCWLERKMNGDVSTDMPMVFFNACGTTMLDPTCATSLISPLYKNENSCIIATAGNVSDRLAAVMSQRFYNELFTGATVGQALHRAKWRILRDWTHPMGLLYSIHINASLGIRPIPEWNDDDSSRAVLERSNS
jgi:CHAT domain